MNTSPDLVALRMTVAEAMRIVRDNWGDHQTIEKAFLANAAPQSPAEPTTLTFDEATAAIHQACVALAKKHPHDNAGFIPMTRDVAIDAILAAAPAEPPQASDPSADFDAYAQATRWPPQASGLTDEQVLAPHYRGYAYLGTGQYLLNNSAPDDGDDPELIISIATEEQKAGRTIGDHRDNEPGQMIQPEDMCVRIRFANVAGLDALESQLRMLREECFAATKEPKPTERFPENVLELIIKRTMGKPQYMAQDIVGLIRAAQQEPKP